MPLIQNTYTCESVFEFLMCIPSSPEIAATVYKNIKIYGEYEWEDKNSLSTFMYAAGFLLKSHYTL